MAAPLLALTLMGCGRSEEEEARRTARFKAEAAREQELCRDKTSCGDLARPDIQFDRTRHTLRKWNNQWFLVPNEYDAYIGMGFYWPSKNQPAKGASSPGADWPIELYIRSHSIPPEPRGYRRIESAERDGRIVRRLTVRPGLDRVEYVDLHPSTGERDSRPRVSYVATTRRTPEGLPPVLGCNIHPDPKRAGAGAGFHWRDGIYVELLIREGHVCEDWPELFDEVMRVLNLVKGV